MIHSFIFKTCTNLNMSNGYKTMFTNLFNCFDKFMIIQQWYCVYFKYLVSKTLYYYNSISFYYETKKYI